ncbi:MAG: hypothetical protein INH43_21745 [Acidobacteriaceae bacterium]|nr:hypothetical protein [Acidobacteriaceae bacterium]
MGRPLGDAERVVVRAYAGEESAGQGGTAAENWERLLATQSAWRERVVAVPEEELDAAMAEALDAVRSGWRP